MRGRLCCLGVRADFFFEKERSRNFDDTLCLNEKKARQVIMAHNKLSNGKRSVLGKKNLPRPLAGAKPSGHEVLKRLTHQELVQSLAKAPRSRLLQNEFVARYKDYIRQTVARAVYDMGKTRASGILREMTEDLVNEVFYRVFRNDCRVLRGVEAHYESSIFAYLRVMCLNMVRNFIRDHFTKEPLALCRAALAWNQEGETPNLLEQMPGEEEQERAAHIHEAALCAAEVWSKQVSFAQNMDRNLLVFKLHFLYGYHYDEIARIKGLGLGESGVGNTIARLKYRLQSVESFRERLLH